MKNYKEAFAAIQRAKKLIKGLSFEEAREKLCGYNYDGEVFDFDYENITGTVWNENEMAKIHSNCIYYVIDEDWEHEYSEPMTESDLIEKIDW